MEHILNSIKHSVLHNAVNILFVQQFFLVRICLHYKMPTRQLGSDDDWAAFLRVFFLLSVFVIHFLNDLIRSSVFLFVGKNRPISPAACSLI